MGHLPASVVAMFTAAGWQQTDNSRDEVRANAGAQSRASAIIAEFGGLRVGCTGPGRDLAASDIHFYSSARPEVASILESWRSLGEMSAIATAHNDHMIVFVSAAGNFYAFTDPDGKLYLVGHSFSEAMERLLLGINYGPAVVGDA